MIDFTDQRSQDGVTRRSFELTVAGDRVPAVIRVPHGASGSRPLILMGPGEGASWERFFQRHLCGTAKAGVLQAA